MRSKAVARGLVVALIILGLLAPLVPAQTDELVEGENKLAYWPTPASSNAEAEQDLFVTVMAIAIFVFIFVEALLLYILFRFRRNRAVPPGELHRGHTRAEIVWTIVPAVILLFIGVISAQTMEETDRIPKDIDFTVKVEGFQWAWNFIYPDGTASSNLYVQKDKKVRLEVTSKDVIHAVWIPSLGIKLDAVPGRTNVVWFQARDAGTYTLKCAEFCNTHPEISGSGHHSMISRVVVCDPTAAGCLPFGQVSVKDCRGQASCEVRVVNNLFVPQNVLADPGQTVTWTWVEGFHSVTPDDASKWGGNTGTPVVGVPTTFSFTFAADGAYPYHCIPHASQNPDGSWIGMVGTVKVGTAAST